MWLALLSSRIVWAFLGAASLAGALWFGWHHYNTLKAEAALVPVLKEQLATYDSTAMKLSDRLAKVNAARDNADQLITKYQDDLKKIQSQLAEASAHAPAQVNPVCRPSPDDRKLRNSTLANLLRPSTDTGAAPVSITPVTPH